MEVFLITSLMHKIIIFFQILGVVFWNPIDEFEIPKEFMNFTNSYFYIFQIYYIKIQLIYQ